MGLIFNNIYVKHKGNEVSIAQHKDNGTTWVQEAAILPATSDMYIVRYGNSLTSLIRALQEIRDEINKDHIRESSSKSDATGTQVTASSTAQEGQQA